MSAAADGSVAYSVEEVEGDDGVRKRRVRLHPRSRTLSVKRLSKRDLYAGAAEYPASINEETPRPTTRGECLQGENVQRPCPYVSCKHHLYLDINERTGSIKFNFPDLEVWEMAESCALDIADRGGVTLEEVGDLHNKTRERIRQLERAALAKIERSTVAEALREHLEETTKERTYAPAVGVRNTGEGR